MDHLTDTQLIGHIFDGFALSASGAAHLVACKLCRTQLQTLKLLECELAIAHQSQPVSESLSAYYQLFCHVQQAPSRLANLVQTVRAGLAWDSRQLSAWQGVRTATTNIYRQLYTTERAEIELMVATRGHQRDLEGDIIPVDTDKFLTPALIQLQPYAASTLYETQSDAQGRFCMLKVTPGHYQMGITLLNGLGLTIDGLEIV